MGLRNKDLISIHDLSVGEVATILDVAKKLKRKQKRGGRCQKIKTQTKKRRTAQISGRKNSGHDFFQSFHKNKGFF